MPRQLKAKINAANAIPEITKFLGKWDFGKGGAEIKITPIGETLDYKAVFAIWMRHLAKSFTERGNEKDSPDQMHDLMCHRFLGQTGERTVGKTIIPSALRTITYPKQLDRGEFYNFMRKVEEWSAHVGVVMPEKSSQYQEDKDKQNT